MAAPVASTPTWASGTSLALSALSALGGAAIAVGWLLSAQRSHLRQKLILGLGLTGASSFTPSFLSERRELVADSLFLSSSPPPPRSPARIALADFTQGVTSLIGSALQLSGNPYRTNSPACNGSGFVCAFPPLSLSLSQPFQPRGTAR